MEKWDESGYFCAMRQNEATTFSIAASTSPLGADLECGIHVSGRYPVGEEIEYVHPPPHFNRLFLMVSGECTVAMGGGCETLRAGEVWLLPVWRSFRARYASNSEFVYFHLELLDGLGLDLFRHCRRPRRVEAPGLFEQVVRAYPGHTAAEHLLCLTCVFHLIVMAASEWLGGTGCLPTATVRYADLMRRIRARPDASLTIKQLADEAGVSRHVLAKGFRRETGMSLKEALQTIILDAALRCLATTHLTHGEIARHLGFRDPAYFHRAFRRRFGQSPGAYRHGLTRGSYEPQPPVLGTHALPVGH